MRRFLLALPVCNLVSFASIADATEVANPAATFCIEQGGQFQIVEGSDGQSGLCALDDGAEVDAWEYFREQHGASTTNDEGKTQSKPH